MTLSIRSIAATAAVAVAAALITGSILTQYTNLGGERSAPGYPVGDRFKTGDGTSFVQLFQFGTLTAKTAS